WLGQDLFIEPVAEVCQRSVVLPRLCCRAQALQLSLHPCGDVLAEIHCPEVAVVNAGEVFQPRVPREKGEVKSTRQVTVLVDQESDVGDIAHSGGKWGGPPGSKGGLPRLAGYHLNRQVDRAGRPPWVREGDRHAPWPCDLPDEPKERRARIALSGNEDLRLGVALDRKVLGRHTHADACRVGPLG